MVMQSPREGFDRLVAQPWPHSLQGGAVRKRHAP